MNFKELLLIRPYSLVCFGLIGLIANLLVRGAFIVDSLLIMDFFAPVFLWCANMLFSEAVQKDKNRIGLGYFAFFSILFLAIVVYREFLAFAIVAIGLVLSYLYSIKNKNTILSPFSFVFRGFKEVLIFAIVLMFYLHSFDALFSFISNNWEITLMIYLVTISRNLIGDVRDVKADKYTFPKKFGVSSAMLVSSAIMLFVILLSPDLYVSFPIIAILILAAFKVNAYQLHKIYIISSTAFFMNYLFYILGYNLILINLFYVSVLLSLTYDFVPRKINKLYLNKVMK